jgi:uncharacterized membrane protein
MRLGHESRGSAGEWSVEWTLKRNCSLAPRQLMGWFSLLCALSLLVGTCFWWAGARMVMPFTSLELLAVGAAMLAYARHAADREWIGLCGDRLTVERACGGCVERVEFQRSWVQVQAGTADGDLVELSGQGRWIAVGRHVRPAQRRLLADELRMALRRAGPVDRGATDGIEN